MAYRAEPFRERPIEKETSIRQHVKRGFGETIATSRDQLQEAVAQERWLASCDPKHGRRGIDEIDQAKVFREAIRVIDVSRWLRAHQAETVALLCDENEVVRRSSSKEHAYEAARIHRYDVAVVEVIELMQSPRDRYPFGEQLAVDESEFIAATPDEGPFQVFDAANLMQSHGVARRIHDQNMRRVVSSRS
jgi:hypothetical protein